MPGLYELSGRFAGEPFEGRIESGFRVETDLVGNGDDGQMFVLGREQQSPGLFYAIAVDEIRKILIEALIDNL